MRAARRLVGRLLRVALVWPPLFVGLGFTALSALALDLCEAIEGAP